MNNKQSVEQTNNDNRYDNLVGLFKQAEADRFWGEFVLRYRDGILVLINRNETIRPDAVGLFDQKKD